MCTKRRQRLFSGWDYLFSAAFSPSFFLPGKTKEARGIFRRVDFLPLFFSLRVKQSCRRKVAVAALVGPRRRAVETADTANKQGFSFLSLSLSLSWLSSPGSSFLLFYPSSPVPNPLSLFPPLPSGRVSFSAPRSENRKSFMELWLLLKVVL